jgi:hypothetical protein
MNAMSSDAPGPRPRQVTVGGWLVAISSAMLVASVFDAMARLHSVDTRDALVRVLTTGSAKGLGISVTDAIGVVRAALFVAGASAAVTAVLGVFVLQRHVAARVVLTVAAVPVVLTAPFSGGFLALVVGAGTALLWSRPARDWFAGRPPARPEVRPVPARVGGPPPASTRAAPGDWPPPTIAPPRDGPVTGPLPPPTPGWGERPTFPAAYSPGPVLPPPPAEVPAQVRIACILTWVFSVVTAGLYVLIGVALLVDRHRMLDLLRDNPTVRDSKLDDDQLVTVIVTVSALIALWCLAACALAFLSWRRHVWAWILLIASIGAALLVEAAALPYSLLHLAAAAVALRMLLARPTRAWFRGAGGPRVSAPRGWVPPPGWAPPSGPPTQPPAGRSPERPSDGPADRPSGKPPVW